MADPYRWSDPYQSGDDRFSDRWDRETRRPDYRREDGRSDSQRREEGRWREPQLHSHHQHHHMDWRAPEERGFDRYLEDRREAGRAWRGEDRSDGRRYTGDRYTYLSGEPRGGGYYDRYGAGLTSRRDDHDGVRHEDRSWVDKASDEVQSWFGDREAEARRAWDAREGEHRGRGPKGYKRADERVQDDVSDRLADDSWLDASDIEVKVENGEVTLSGAVVCRPDKRRAEDLAERVSGVSHVQNNLRIAGRLAESPEEIARMTPLD